MPLQQPRERCSPSHQPIHCSFFQSGSFSPLLLVITRHPVGGDVSREVSPPLNLPCPACCPPLARRLSLIPLPGQPAGSHLGWARMDRVTSVLLFQDMFSFAALCPGKKSS